MSVDTLQMKIRKKKNPTVLCMDIRAEAIPGFLMNRAVAACGESMQAMAEAYVRFGTAVLDALVDLVPAVKFNTAYYDALGADGAMALRTICAYAKKRGYYVFLETMRSDQAAAAALCAQTYFGTWEAGGVSTTLYDADALCIGAFTGSDGIRPYLAYCGERDKSIFILARTPNKSSREVQDLISGDRVIHTVMTDLAMRWSTGLFAKSGYSEVGVVVGATQGQLLQELRQKYDRLFFLIPNYGMPGCGAKEVRYAFDKFGHGAVVEAPAELLEAWKKAEIQEESFTEPICAAVVKARDEIARFVTVI